ncbi:DUF2334 domain-containing protein [Halotalea alkalilenta]|uniref:Deacetylase n=1 Tax=Halotalea alkalilenta TaxID=376489 RepID=A0A172YH54_9GAMM|nr:polysaccharide deacetylase family protein [Halotalea alkalilenta]ANF58446.1 deacetylase [Halotalea alkalilenta]
MSEAKASQSFIVALHDIAPATWPDYRPFVERMDALGQVRMSWLVVPDFHHRSATFDDPAFLALLERRLELGDELVLHGLYHCDEGPAPSNLRDYLMRRFYTVEGEFYALEEDQARARIEQGLELFARRGWPLHGFVAPAWLMSPGTRKALASLPLRYTSDPGHLIDLPSFTAHRVPTLVWSARARWRRAMSLVVNEYSRHRYRRLETFRLGLHPVDMRFDASREYWYRCIERLLGQGYRAETKRDWFERSNPRSSPLRPQ